MKRKNRKTIKDIIIKELSSSIIKKEKMVKFLITMLRFENGLPLADIISIQNNILKNVSLKKEIEAIQDKNELNKKDEVINKQNNKNLQNYIYKFNVPNLRIFTEIDTSSFSIETIYYALTELIKRDKITLLDFTDYINEFISIDSNEENINLVQKDLTNLLSFINSTDNLINDLVLTYELNENTTNLLRELIFNHLNKDEINLEEIKTELISILKKAQSDKTIKTQLILNKIEDLFGTEIKKECIKLFKEVQLNKVEKVEKNLKK